MEEFVDEEELQAVPPITLDGLASMDLGEVGYVRLSDSRGRMDWTQRTLEAAGVTEPVDVVSAYAKILRGIILHSLQPGESGVMVKATVMSIKGERVLRTYSYRCSRSSDATALALTSLRDADSLAATPGLRALVKTIMEIARGQEVVSRQQSGHAERFDLIYDRMFKRQNELIDTLEARNEKDRAAFQKAEERWQDERDSLNQKLVMLAETGIDGAGGKKLDLTSFHQMASELRETLGPLAHLVPGAAAGKDDGGPLAEILGTLLAGASPEKLANLEAIKKKVSDKATVETILSLLGLK